MLQEINENTENKYKNDKSKRAFNNFMENNLNSYLTLYGEVLDFIIIDKKESNLIKTNSNRKNNKVNTINEDTRILLRIKISNKYKNGKINSSIKPDLYDGSNNLIKYNNHKNSDSNNNINNRDIKKEKNKISELTEEDWDSLLTSLENDDFKKKKTDKSKVNIEYEHGESNINNREKNEFDNNVVTNITNPYFLYESYNNLNNINEIKEKEFIERIIKEKNFEVEGKDISVSQSNKYDENVLVILEGLWANELKNILQTKRFVCIKGRVNYLSINNINKNKYNNNDDFNDDELDDLFDNISNNSGDKGITNEIKEDDPNEFDDVFDDSDNNEHKRNMIKEISESNINPATKHNQTSNILNECVNNKTELDIQQLASDNSNNNFISFVLIDLESNVTKGNNDKNNNKEDVSTNQHNQMSFITIEPEVLIAPKLIKTSHPCERRGILTHFFKYSESNKSATIGTIIHEIFSKYIQNKSKHKDINVFIEEMLSSFKHDLINYYSNEKEVINDLLLYEKSIKTIYEKYFGNKEAINKETIIEEYLDSEKAFQSQVLGIRGIIDILLSTRNLNRNGNENELVLTPLEIKTGTYIRNEDIWQIMIYCLLLSEDQNAYLNTAILLYLKKESIFKHELKSMESLINLNIRNSIASSLYNQERNIDYFSNKLPQLIDTTYNCQNCFINKTCFVNFLCLENTTSNSELKDKENHLKRKDFSEILELTDNDLIKQYYNKYMSLINSEENYDLREQRIKLENLSNYNELFLSQYSASENNSFKIIKIFENHNSVDILLEDKDFNSRFDDLERRLISDFFLVFDEGTKQVMKGIIKKRVFGEQVGDELFNLYSFEKKGDRQKSYLLLNILNKYIPEKHFFFKNKITSLKLKSLFLYSSSKVLRGNLVSLILNKENTERIILYKEPTLFALNHERKLFISRTLKKFEADYILLNTQQKQSIIKACFLSNDYSLILGYPGSGKSTVVCLIIRILVFLEKKVLLSAYTNQAVDNIMIKLKKSNIDFLRITNRDILVDEEIRNNTLKNRISSLNIREANKLIKTNLVFGVTTSSVCHSSLQSLEFDVCIIDEACQIFEPSILSPILKSKRFILAGDPLQLPALLKSNNEERIDSLFVKLKEKHPLTCDKLTIQYRMNSDIMSLSNTCVYNNEMKCGDRNLCTKGKINIIPKNLLSVFSKENDSISKIDKEANIKFLDNNIWIMDVLDLERSVVFIDYEKILQDNPYNKDNFENYTNKYEATIIKNILFSLKLLNFNMSKLSVITPFLNQETFIRENVSDIDRNINVITIDKSQGMEKDIIIVSMVKESENTRILKDINRINVAFTRPKYKLIIVGRFEVLKMVDELNKYLDVIEKKNWKCEISYLSEISSSNMKLLNNQ